MVLFESLLEGFQTPQNENLKQKVSQLFNDLFKSVCTCFSFTDGSKASSMPREFGGIIEDSSTQKRSREETESHLEPSKRPRKESKEKRGEKRKRTDELDDGSRKKKIKFGRDDQREIKERTQTNGNNGNNGNHNNAQQVKILSEMGYRYIVDSLNSNQVSRRGRKNRSPPL